MPIQLADVYNDTRGARKVMVVALGFLGDAVHLLPALWELHRNYPAAELHVATTPLGCEVIRLVPCVARVWPIRRNPRQSNWREDWRTVRALRRERFDLAINLSSSDRTILWTALTGARCRVAHSGKRTPFWRTWLIPRWVPRQPPAMPIAEQHRRVLAACGMSLATPRWEFSLPDAARQKAEALVPVEAIHLSISASMSLKEWPLESWIALVKALLASKPGLQLVATGSSQPREQERLRALAQAVANERLIVLGNLSVAELAAVIQRCRLHVGADSGALHLAVLVGAPTVSLFRDYQDASSWAPTGPSHCVLRVPCVCVNQRVQPCAAAGRPECLDRLAVSDVQTALLARLTSPREITTGPL